MRIDRSMQRNNEVGGGVHPACAACKHQRKKCDNSCVLAPYFPANKSREFQAVHRVFGVANVQKIVKFVGNDEDRRRVADSLIWEALCRQKDPVLGPYGEYKKLLDELRLHKLHNFTHTHTQAAPTAAACKQQLPDNNITGCVSLTSTTTNADHHHHHLAHTNTATSTTRSPPAAGAAAANILRYPSANNANDHFVANLSSYHHHVFPPSSYSLHHPHEKLIKQESHFHHQSPSLPTGISPHAQFYHTSGQYNWQDNGR